MESRRGARIAARFWVAIEGVDKKAELRHGDVSATGMYFECDKNLGGVNTVQLLHLASFDKERSLDVMAHVVRTVSIKDASRGKIQGVALQFMPASDASASEVKEFVRYVLALRVEEESAAAVQHRADVEIVRGDDKLHAVAQRFSVHGLLLDTSWALRVGETVSIKIEPTRERRAIRLKGTAIRVTPRADDGDRYRIAIQVKDEEYAKKSMPPPPPGKTPKNGRVGPGKRSEPRVMNGILENLLAPDSTPEPIRTEHLSGALARIRFPTLLSLIDMERMSGTLTVARGRETYSIYFREGQPIDAEAKSGGSRSPRAIVARVFAWEDGSFKLDLEEVDRADTIKTRTPALLLELAKAEDDAKRQS